jgi:hypothetical protein
MEAAERFTLRAEILHFWAWGGASPMTTNDGFSPFLSEYAVEPEQPRIGKSRGRGVILPRILKTSILGAAAAAIVFAILSVGMADKSTPIIQSTADTEIRQPPAKALLSQFQAWAAHEDARARALFGGGIRAPSRSVGTDRGSTHP